MLANPWIFRKALSASDNHLQCTLGASLRLVLAALGPWSPFRIPHSPPKTKATRRAALKVKWRRGDSPSSRRRRVASFRAASGAGGGHRVRLTSLPLGAPSFRIPHSPPQNKSRPVGGLQDKVENGGFAFRSATSCRLPTGRLRPLSAHPCASSSQRSERGLRFESPILHLKTKAARWAAFKIKWRMGDSNPRPIDCEPIALPTELIPRWWRM